MLVFFYISVFCYFKLPLHVMLEANIVLFTLLHLFDNLSNYFADYRLFIQSIYACVHVNMCVIYILLAHLLYLFPENYFWLIQYKIL